jgi:hypothetical protein
MPRPWRSSPARERRMCRTAAVMGFIGNRYIRYG